MAQNHNRPVLRVAVPTPLRRCLEYLPPAALDTASVLALRRGVRLKVPLGGRQVIGILVSVHGTSNIDRSKLRAAMAIIDHEPLLSSSISELITWAARYYQHPPGEVWQTALPQLLRTGRAADSTGTLNWRLSPDGLGLPDQALRNAPKQAALIQILRVYGHADRTLLKTEGISAAITRQLEQKGLIERFMGSPAPTCRPEVNKPALNRGQKTAFTSITTGAPGYSCSLLEGVTGSGKTEVYLQLIERELEAGRQALVLIPEIGLTPQTLERFRTRFGAAVVTFNSEMSDRDRLSAWNAARTGAAPVVIGTRSAVWVPLKNTGLIIVDEEHDLSYKQQDGFRYHARDTAIKRAQLEDIPVVLGTATPSLETLHNAVSGRFRHLQLPDRAGGGSLPAIETLDIRRAELAAGMSPVLLDEIRAELKQQRQVLLFINRRGYAPSLMCHDCGWTAICPDCDTRMTVHARDRQLRCHHCEYVKQTPRRCEECASHHLLAMGVGTQRIEDALKKLVPEVPILRVDRDSTGRKGSMARIVEQVNGGQPCILIGTQMLAKGHHFPRVTLVGVLDADHGLFSSDLRGSERMAQLLVQVAGRAGRTSMPGRVILQTHYPDHPALQVLISQGYSNFAGSLLSERQQYSMPPFCYMALVRAESASADVAETLLRDCRTKCDHPGSEVIMLGPLPSTMSRRAGQFRFFLMLRSQTRRSLHAVTESVIDYLESRKTGKKCRWSIDIDPMESA